MAGAGAVTAGASGRRLGGGGAAARPGDGWGVAGAGVAFCGSRCGWGSEGCLLGAPGGTGGWARSAVGRSTVLWPKAGRAGTGLLSRCDGTETRRAAGVGTPAGPTFRSRPPAASDAVCGGRVATTGRWTLPSGGRTPRLAVGTKLAGVVAI